MWLTFNKRALSNVVAKLISRRPRILRQTTAGVAESLPSPSSNEIVRARPELNSGPRPDDGSRRADLCIPYLTGPEFRGRYREEVLLLEKSLSLEALKNFLETGCGHTDLSRVFSTKRRHLRVQEAIARFEESVTNWWGDERFDSRVTWILPRRVRTNDLALLLDSMAEVFKTFDGTPANWQEAFPEIDRWLPWLSLELVHKIRSMKSGDISFLHRVLIKATRDFGVTTEVYPWTPGFPDGLAELPIHALYQFEPSYSALRILNDLKAVFCLNVGHLSAFHPLAWKAIHTAEPGFWLQLARAISHYDL